MPAKKKQGETAAKPTPAGLRQGAVQKKKKAPATPATSAAEPQKKQQQQQRRKRGSRRKELRLLRVEQASNRMIVPYATAKRLLHQFAAEYGREIGKNVRYTIQPAAVNTAHVLVERDILQELAQCGDVAKSLGVATITPAIVTMAAAVDHRRVNLGHGTLIPSVFDAVKATKAAKKGLDKDNEAHKKEMKRLDQEEANLLLKDAALLRN